MPAVEALDRLSFEFERQRQLLDRALTGPDGAQSLKVGVALEVEQALDQMVRILHLIDRLGSETLAQAVIAPVVEHLGVEEVLIDCRQLSGQYFVEKFDYPQGHPALLSFADVTIGTIVGADSELVRRKVRAQAAEAAAGSRSGAVASRSASSM